jgi:hypothetical protein
MQVSTAKCRAGGSARLAFSPNDALYFWLAVKTSLRMALIGFSCLGEWFGRVGVSHEVGKIPGWVVPFERRFFVPGDCHVSGKSYGEFLAVEAVTFQR